MLLLRGLHVKHAVKHAIWVPAQHLLWDQGKPRKTLIELAGRRTFRTQTNYLRIIHKNSVRTSQEVIYVSATKPTG
jgi:hypothetical protein